MTDLLIRSRIFSAWGSRFVFFLLTRVQSTSFGWRVGTWIILKHWFSSIYSQPNKPLRKTSTFRNSKLKLQLFPDLTISYKRKKRIIYWVYLKFPQESKVRNGQLESWKFSKWPDRYDLVLTLPVGAIFPFPKSNCRGLQAEQKKIFLIFFVN